MPNSASNSAPLPASTTADGPAPITASIPSVAEAVAPPTVDVTPGRNAEMPLGVVFVLASCVSLQFGAALAVTVFPVLGSFGTTSARFVFAALFVLVIFRPKFWKWNVKQWLAVVVFGLVLASMNSFFYAGLERIPLGIAVSIEFLGPLALAAILSRRLKDMVWIVLALAGIALFFFDDFIGESRLDLLGVVFVLIAGLFWALYIQCSAWVGRLVPGTGGLAGSILVGSLALLPFGVQIADELAAAPKLILLCLGIGLLSSAIPYTLEFMALRRVPKPVFGVLLSLEPAIAALAGWILLGQGLSTLATGAILLVVTASAGSTLAARTPKADREVIETSEAPVPA